MRTRSHSPNRPAKIETGQASGGLAGGRGIIVVDALGRKIHQVTKLHVPWAEDLGDDQALIGSEVGQAYTNDTGAVLGVGDVVVIDGTTAVTTTTPQDTRPVGVVTVGGDDGEDVVVQTAGRVDLVNVTAAVTAGYYAETSTTAAKATESVTRREGSFAVFLSSGTEPSALLFGIPDSLGTGANSSTVNVSHLITGGPPFKLIAHRGDINPVDGYPQDTLEAYRQAMIRGADGLEFGVQRDADGTWQCIHDTTVDATTDGTGAVSSKTTAQMAALNINGGLGYNAARHGTSLNVPTLDQALDAILPYDPIIQLAVKELTVAAWQALAQFVVARGLQERVMMLGVTTGGGPAAQAIAPNVLVDDNTTQDVAIPISSDVVSAAYVQGFEPAPLFPYFTDALWGTDETATLTNLWTYGCRGALTNDLPAALLWRNEVVLGVVPTTHSHNTLGPILLASDAVTPLLNYALEASDGGDVLYASTP